MMIHESIAAKGCLERQTAQARRRAHVGDVAGASATYEALWPEARRLSPNRRLRFLGQYAEILGREQCVLAFERIRGLADEAEQICGGRQGQMHMHNVQRHVGGVLGALIRVAREVGESSALGQIALERAWALTSALHDLNDESKASGYTLRPVNDHGRRIWMEKINDGYRIHRNLRRA